jgi:hypothetical protein
MQKINKKLNLNPLQPTKNSSLGHLAYGYLAFRAWRKIVQLESKDEK